MLGDFRVPDFLLLDPSTVIQNEPQFDYEGERNRVWENYQTAQPPLHKDFLGVGPDISPGITMDENLPHSPIIYAALQYGYKTGPEKRELPDFRNKYVSVNIFYQAKFLTTIQNIPAEVMQRAEDSVAEFSATSGTALYESARSLLILCEEDRRRHDAEHDINSQLMRLFLPFQDNVNVSFPTIPM